MRKQLMLVQRCLQDLPAPAKVTSQPSDLRILMTQRYEVGQCALGMAGRVAQNQMP